jgi:hypothetical protein
MATAEDVQEEGDFDIVTKTSELVSVEKTTTQKLQEEQQLAAKELREEFERNISLQEQALNSAQAADSRTQQYIQQQLEATKSQLTTIQQSLQE